MVGTRLLRPYWLPHQQGVTLSCSPRLLVVAVVIHHIGHARPVHDATDGAPALQDQASKQSAAPQVADPQAPKNAIEAHLTIVFQLRH